MKKSVLQRLNRLNTIVAYQKSNITKRSASLQVCLINISPVLNTPKPIAINTYNEIQQACTDNQTLKKRII